MKIPLLKNTIILKLKLYELILFFFIFFIGLFIAIKLISVLFSFLRLDENVTGPIGDTIGPVVGIIGAVLIYFTFKSQERANKIQQDHNAYELLFNLYFNLKDDFNSLRFETSFTKDEELIVKNYEKNRSIKMFAHFLELRIKSEEFKENSYFNELSFFLSSMVDFSNTIYLYNIDDEKKGHLLKLTLFFYDVKILKPLNKIIEITQNSTLHQDLFNECSDIKKSMKDISVKYYHLQNSSNSV